MVFEGHDWDGLATSLGYRDEHHMWYDLYISNLFSINQIAAKLGFSPATIAKKIEEAGLPKRSRGGANNAGKMQLRLHLLDQRLVFDSTTPYLAKLLKCNPTTIWKYKTAKRNAPIGGPV